MPITKFNPALKCPKCGSEKFSTRFEEASALEQDQRRRERLGWPQGELIVSGCNVCSFTTISRPLDFQEAKP